VKKHSNKTIDDVIRFILENSPREGEEVKKNPFKGRRLPYDLVGGAIDELHSEGRFLDLESFDISGTFDMWHTSEGFTNFELARKGIKQLLKSLQRKSAIPLEQIIPKIGYDTFHTTPINKYKTTLCGMLAQVYEDSPYTALKDLIDHDEEYAEFRDLQPYDMHHAPRNTWLDNVGTKKHELARNATKQLLKTLQRQKPAIPLEQIIPQIGHDTFNITPINKYKTTLIGMLCHVYDGSAYQALKDLIDHDKEYAEFKDLQPHDMHHAPSATWLNEDGTKNFALARTATKLLIRAIQAQQSDAAVEQVLPQITVGHFNSMPINKYKKTLGGMIYCAYNSSAYRALKDLIDHDDEFKEFRDFQPYDMQHSPRETWLKIDGTKNHKLARAATKQLLITLQHQQPGVPLQQIIPQIIQPLFQKTLINRYKTNLSGMFCIYQHSPYRALKDLAENDREYAHLLSVIETLRHKAV
jgi:hypothetical protein